MLDLGCKSLTLFSSRLYFWRNAYSSVLDNKLLRDPRLLPTPEYIPGTIIYLVGIIHTSYILYLYVPDISMTCTAVRVSF